MSIIQMGEELIGHPSTAVSELVKNAYDADADKCWVYTQYDQSPLKTFLIIKDNGLGMSSKTLFGDWLKPSISSKRDEDREKRRSKIYERRYLGSKGIGRLAAMALGRYLTVISKQRNESQYNWIKIDREVFKTDISLDQVSFPGGKADSLVNLFKDEKLLKSLKITPNGNLINLISSEPLNEFDEGTMIVLEDLDDSVKGIIEEEFEYKELEETSIFKSLTDLITPLKLTNDIQDELVKEKILDRSLKIDNGAGVFELFYGINFIKDRIKNSVSFIPVEPAEIIKHYHYRIFGKVTSEFDVVGRYICRRLEEDKRDENFNFSASEVMSEDESRVRQIEEIDKSSTLKTNVGEFFFDIRVYDLDSDAKEQIAQHLKVSGKREATNTLKKYLGLKISKNGFSVKPYGDEEQDWLGLGAKRVQRHQISIGPNQILGYAFLYSPTNDGLSEKTNREGFFENKAFLNFKKAINGILEQAGRRRAKYRELHNLGRVTKSKHDRPDTEKFIQYILSSSSDSNLIEKTKRFVSETNTALDNMEHSLSFSQRLATLGTGLELVYHELSQPITSLGASRSSIEINARKIENEKLKKSILARTDNMNSSIDMLEKLKNSLQPAIGKSRDTLFKPLETFKKVCSLFEQQFKDDNIILEINQNAEPIELKGQEYIFWISFLNIINNAVYWVRYADSKRVIIFEYVDKDCFVISNTGPKIDEDDLDVIFEYGITAKKEQNATGLGLAYTNNMLTSKGWNIWAENRDYGPAFFIKKENN